MASSNLVQWGGLAAILSGALLIVFVLLSEVAPEGFFYLYILVLLLLVVALYALHARQAGQSGLLGRIGFVVALIGTGGLAMLFVVVGVAETLFGFDLDELPGALGLLFFVLFLAFMVGIVLFGIATIRAGVLPRIAAVLFAFGLLVGLVIDLLSGAFFVEEATEWGFYIGGTAFAVGLIWLGYAAWSGRGASAGQPARVR